MKLLTLETQDGGEQVALHLNHEGTCFLITILSELLNAEQHEHIHLMSEDWGGAELTTNQQNLPDGGRVAHDLKIYYWKE